VSILLDEAKAVCWSYFSFRQTRQLVEVPVVTIT